MGEEEPGVEMLVKEWQHSKAELTKGKNKIK